MDKERYERECRDLRLKEVKEMLHFNQKTLPEDINYRLTQEYEVPEWITVASLDPKDSEIKEYGKGMRSKQRINYKDEADEFDNQEEDSDSELKKKRRRGRAPREESILHSNKKRKLDDDDQGSQSLNSHINLDDDEYVDVSKSSSTLNNVLSNTKLRIKLNSNSNLGNGNYYCNYYYLFILF